MTSVYKPGDVVTLDFPGVAVTKRRPAVVVSSDAYHAARPDTIVGLITTQTAGAAAVTDYLLQDWAAAGPARPFCFPRLPRHRPAYCHLRAHRAIVCERLASRPRAGAPRARTAGCARFTLTACSPRATASQTRNSTCGLNYDRRVPDGQRRGGRKWRPGREMNHQLRRTRREEAARRQIPLALIDSVMQSPQ